MYNLSFLDYLNDNYSIILFHNETENVEKNIVDNISAMLLPELNKRCFGRTIDETLITLQYPCADSSERTFNQFFDSPRCAALMFSSFKGVFVIDCTRYIAFNATAFSKLFDYIGENASSDFKFVVLFNQQCKNDVVGYIAKSSVRNASIVDLELSRTSIEEYKTLVDEDSYEWLIEQYESNASFRKLSPKQIKDCISTATDKKQDLKSAISVAISGNNAERRIGF